MKKILALAVAAMVAVAGEISIEKVYAKESASNAKNGAVFMDIKNSFGTDVRLIGASSSVCEMTEIHTHKHVNGMKMMVKIDEILVPAGGQTQLKPGGDHIMLMGLKKPLRNGETIDVTLKFDTGKTVEIKDVSVINQK